MNKKCKRHSQCNIFFEKVFHKDPEEEEEEKEKEESKEENEEEQGGKANHQHHHHSTVECNEEAYIFV